MTNSHIKQSPFVGYAGFGGGATALALKSGATKIYIEEVFGMYTYKGTGTGIGAESDNQIVNGIDNSTDGGMVWIKNRDQAVSSLLFDTVRGGQVEIKSDSNQAQAGPYTDYNIKTWNTDGFTLTGNGGNTNESAKNYMSWNFRKCEKFFDIITYT